MCSSNYVRTPGMSDSFHANMSLLSRRKLVSASSYGWCSSVPTVVVFMDPLWRGRLSSMVFLWGLTKLLSSLMGFWDCPSASNWLCWRFPSSAMGVRHWPRARLLLCLSRMTSLNPLVVRKLLLGLSSLPVGKDNAEWPWILREPAVWRLRGMMVRSDQLQTWYTLFYSSP